MDTVNLSTAQAHLDEYLDRVVAGERVLIAKDPNTTAALVNVSELADLDRRAGLIHQLALVLGQPRELIEKIAQGELHPAMIGYGLWKGQADLENLAEAIRENRTAQGSRPTPDL